VPTFRISSVEKAKESSISTFSVSRWIGNIGTMTTHLYLCRSPEEGSYCT
jgi:hypothetical protein